MIALRVNLNGKVPCVAGAEDLAVLNAIVSAGGSLGALTKRQREDETPYVYLSVGGLTGRAAGSDENLGWAEQLPLRAGDKVEVEVLETSEVDAPESTRPMDEERQLERERENYEYAKEVYLALRSKFERD